MQKITTKTAKMSMSNVAKMVGNPNLVAPILEVKMQN
jgi:hypothetical protein